MTSRNEDFLFAQEAQTLGYVSEPQVEEAFLLQRRMAEELKLDERISVILVKRGWLAEDQARRVLSRIEPHGQAEQIQGYRLLERVGRGAMGTVYKALHLGLQRVVAIKVLRKDLAEDPTQVERLKAEAHLLASLDHPNIVRALDAGESNGFPFVVMEYVEGETLRERIQRQGPLPEDEALRITRGLADALERARRMGVVHRDVKPGNVLLSQGGGPKLMDLGLAKGPIDLGLTQHGATVGTPQYISPEQAQDPRKADTRSDIYSLGATLYAMLTARPPFEGQTLAEIITKVLYETPTPPRVLNRKVSAEAGYLVERMMLKDASLRYATPAEVVRDVDRILAGRSIIPPGFTGTWEGFLLRQRARRWGRRVGVTLASAVVLGVGIGLWVRRAREAEAVDRAERIATEALEDTVPSRSDDQATVAGQWARASEALRRVGELRPPSHDRLVLRERALEQAHRDYERWRALERSLEPLRQEGRYDEVVTRIEAFAVSVPGVDGPAEVAARTYEGTVRGESEARLEAARREARSAPARTWGELLEAHRHLARVLAGGFVRTPALTSARDHAAHAVSALERSGGEAEALAEEFSGERLRARLDALDVAGLMPEFRRRRDAILSRAALGWQPLEEGWLPSSSVRDRLAARLKEVETDLEGLVSAAWARAARAEEAAAASSDPDEVQRALDRLIAGARALHDGGFPGLSNEAWETRERLAGAFAARQARAREVYERLVEDVLKLLREGHMPEEILARIQVAHDDAAANASVRAGIDDLALLADGLDSLYRNALEEVRARGRIAPVRLRAGGEEKRWDVVEVHPGERAVTVRVQRAGRPGEPQRRGLQELEIGQVAELARGARASLAPLEEAVVLLSDLPERGSGDLRPVLERLRRVQGALKGARREGAFLESVARRVGELAREQEEREAAAHIAYQQADLYVRLKQYPSAHFHLLDLLREDSPRHHTGYVERNEGRIRALMDVVEGELSDEQLLAHLPGARISSQGNVTSALFDFETPVQLEVFRREGGRGLAVLEPYVPPAAVTPEVKPNTRLHLLRGLDGDLHRDRPLSLQNPFDPAETIEVEFDLFTLTSPFFLAVDVDGVQVGVLSVDPTSPAYAERFRFPEDVPLLEKGEKPPTHDGYGRGRGVAFHAGPDFGDPPGWDWPAGAQGAALGEARTGRDVPGPLFSFEPLTRYRVKVVRQRGKMTLFVNDREIRSEEQAEWATRGRSSDREKGIRGGTGRIQIITWTPQAIDDLRLSGVVMERWR